EDLDVTTVGEARRYVDRVEAPEGHADEMVVRTFEVSGLSRAAVEAIPDGLPVGAVFVPDGESGGLLYGTVAALRAVEPDRVGGEAATVLRAVEAAV
ncbi:dihydropteroate synthase, partial [Halobacteriales archaeon QS_5_70_15]